MGQGTVPPDTLESTDNLFTAEVRYGGRGCGTLCSDTCTCTGLIHALYIYSRVT